MAGTRPVAVAVAQRLWLHAADNLVLRDCQLTHPDIRCQLQLVIHRKERTMKLVPHVLNVYKTNPFTPRVKFSAGKTFILPKFPSELRGTYGRRA